MIDSILLATDGSDAAHVAERLGTKVGAKMRVRMSAVSVVEEKTLQGLRADALGIPPGPVEAVESFLKSRAEAAAMRVNELARAQGSDCQVELLRGAADDRITERGQGVDMIVMGRDGEHAGGRTALIGSTVNGVLRKTHKPVLVVPTGCEWGGPIILAFDGSPGSRIAARYAVEIAKRTEQPVQVFVDSKDKGRAAARFDEVRRLLGALPSPAREVSSTLGRPDVKVVDTAKAARAGLIVMGAYGRNRITDYFLGSNAAAVVRTSPVAVLLVR